MSESVGIRALQQHASKVVARVVAGEEIEITDHGRAVARLVPLREGRIEQLTASGRLQPARRPFGPLPKPIRLAPGQPTAAEILAEIREDER